ncbi:NUDIX domain-containing protein [Streptomyces lanatus]|uniref:NUDIX domain-containing protein n=1 Tax=Streptomyces lanatus TaxID=66900 RepID=A0ABV1XQL5_9ACTN
MTLLVAAIIVHDQATNRVVLLQRSKNARFAQGMWDLPVGKSEPGEPITEMAVRELCEETSSPSSSPPAMGPANSRTASRARHERETHRAAAACGSGRWKPGERGVRQCAPRVDRLPGCRLHEPLGRRCARFG